MYKIEGASSFIKVRDTYGGAWRSVALRNKKRFPSEIYFPPLYREAICINRLKVEDIRGLFPYLSEAAKRIYNDIFSNFSNDNEPKNEVDVGMMEESDNSSGED